MVREASNCTGCCCGCCCCRSFTARFFMSVNETETVALTTKVDSWSGELLFKLKAARLVASDISMLKTGS